MKVVENDTDRRAEVHLYADGIVDPLDEYGEYVDPIDNAICCFVPVRPDQKIRVDGKFYGTIINLQYDILIDGICRKSSSFVGKVVTKQKSRCLGSDLYLYQTAGLLIESKLVAKPINPNLVFKEDAPISIGTIEMRVYLLRQFGDEHEVRGMTKYYECEDEGHDSEQPIGYDSIVPDVAITFDKDCPVTDTRTAKKNRKVIDGVRPEASPWAIFRFHYRSQSSIEQSRKYQTYSAAEKKQTKPHTLRIKALPALELGSKPREKDGASTGLSSSAASLRGTPAPTSRSSEPHTIRRTATRSLTPIPTMKANLAPGMTENSLGCGSDTVSEHSAMFKQTCAEPAAPTCPGNIEEVPKTLQATPSPQKEKEPASDNGIVKNSVTHTEQCSPGLTESGIIAEQKKVTTDRTRESAAAVPLIASSTPVAYHRANLSQSTSAQKVASPPITPTKRVSESITQDRPAEKRTKSSLIPAIGSSPSTVVDMHRQAAELRKNRKKMAELRKEVDDKLAPHEATIQQIYAQEREEHDREAKELEARLELLAYLEGDGTMDAE